METPPATDRTVRIVAHLDDGRTSLLFTSEGSTPALSYWGPSLGPLTPDAGSGVVAALERPVPNGGLDVDPPVGLVTEAGAGWFGRPGLEGHRPGGGDFAPRFERWRIDADGSTMTAVGADAAAGLELRLDVTLHPSGVVTAAAVLTNVGSTPYQIQALRLSLPVPDRASELATVGGRWANEAGIHRVNWERQRVTVENRHGKTSHEQLGLVVAGTPGFGEQRGEVWVCHLAWSGNFEIVADAITDGRRVLSLGELLGSGEVVLDPGASYATPVIHAAYGDGLVATSRAFHRHLRARPGHPVGPRPVHLNTWEAVYFDHDLDRLRALAEVGAELGIERYVLDDGWFHARRNDRAGLGDWWVDPVVWPQGLDPLISHVRGLGMEFGIWVEPEMVNPDSDLYRTHPDWVLTDLRHPPVLGRHQLVLDLGRDEVRRYLFDHLDALLANHDIGYLKWDHNRDLVAPASEATGAGGRSGVRAATLGLYDLLDRLRAAHPGVEIETCASGGGRVDYGILARSDRVWTSDSLDALDRVSIQRGFSLFVPPELLGAHVGSPRCHTTGRRHDLAFRAAVALFGTFGVEWNVLEANAAERAELAAWIALHKRLRPLLHTGDTVRLDHPDSTVAVNGVVSADRSQGVLAVVRLASGPTIHTAPLRVPDLEPERAYLVRRSEAPGDPLARSRSQPGWLDTGVTLTGRQLATIGLQLPALLPEQCLLLELRANG